MLKVFSDLAVSIRERSDGRKIVYIPNPGNYGDGLIRYGTKQFLSDFDLDHYELNVGYTRVKYQLLPLLVKSDRYLFVYGGGGAWCDAYSFGRDYCSFISKFSGNLVVLPSTYALKKLPHRGLMYRRDLAESAENNPSSKFCHDMAFYIGCRPERHALSVQPPSEKVGVFMRTDRETRFSNVTLPDNNVDLSLQGDHMSNGDDFLRAVSHFEEIYTDRLHVCIAACTIGRRVKLVTGNYFKIKRIYESSIKPRFGHLVELLDDDFRPGDLAR